MRATFLAFFGIALLWLHQPTLARRGGGSGSSGSSGGSGTSSGGSGSSSGGGSSSSCYGSSFGNASDPFDPMYKNQWLYKFVGSYYNGSAEVEATIYSEDVSCDDQKPVFKQKLDAVLIIGELPPDLSESSVEPYMFSIVGWKEGTNPGGTPDSETNWVSPDARLIYESVNNCRGPYRKHVTWETTSRKSGDGYTFSSVFGDQKYFDSSRTIFSVSPCNGAAPADFHMEAWDGFDFSYDSLREYEEKRTRANGTFDDTSATLSIAGTFSGKFNWSERYSSSSDTSGNVRYGRYKITFSGSLDRPHSHALSTSGQTPSWTKDRDLLPGGSKATTSCNGGSSSAGSRAEVGRAVLGLTGLGGLVAAGMGIVLW